MLHGWIDTPDTRLEWTLAFVHAAAALRPEEALGLKWMDIDWQNDQINIRRGWSKGRETTGKNEGSMTQVVMHPALTQAIQAWRQESVYSTLLNRIGGPDRDRTDDLFHAMERLQT
jgi:integrase